MSSWNKMSDNSYQYDLGNNIYIVIKPVMVYSQRRRNGKAIGKYADRQCWSPEIMAGWLPATSIRRWSGGGDGYGNYTTLKDAKAASIQEASYVAQAIMNQLNLLKNK